MERKQQWIPFTALSDMIGDVARPLPPLPEGVYLHRENHRMFRIYEDPDEWRPSGFRVEKANPEMRRPHISPIPYIIFSLAGYSHVPSAGDAKVTIFRESDPERSIKEEKEDRTEYTRIADFSHYRHTAIRFVTTCGNPGAFPVLIDLCCEQVPKDIIDERDIGLDEVEWYFRFIRGGWAYTYYIYDYSLIQATIWSLKNIRDRMERDNKADLYSHISGWENLDRLLHLAYLSEDEDQMMDNTPDPSGYLLWAIFCDKWKVDGHEHICEYKTNSYPSKNIKLSYTPGETLTVYENDEEKADYDFTIRGLMTDHIVIS